MTKPLLETRQHGLLVAALDEDHPRGREPRLRHGRCEQVRAREAPQDLAFCPAGDAGREQGCCGTMHSAVAATGHFVQRAHSQPTAGQRPVDLVHAESKRIAFQPRCGQPLDSMAQLLDDGTRHSEPVKLSKARPRLVSS